MKYSFYRALVFNQLPLICNLFLWIHQSVSLPSPPWFNNPRRISETHGMKSALAIKLPTPHEWWSKYFPPSKVSNTWRINGGRGVLKLLFDWYITREVAGKECNTHRKSFQKKKCWVTPGKPIKHVISFWLCSNFSLLCFSCCVFLILTPILFNFSFY